MHELALAQAIVDGVAERAVECRATRVIRVRLRIGEGAGVVSDALRGCFDLLASADPLLNGAHLLIDTVPHRAHCRTCADEFTVVNFVGQCPTCHGWDTDVVSGTELEVRDMEIETGADPEVASGSDPPEGSALAEEAERDIMLATS